MIVITSIRRLLRVLAGFKLTTSIFCIGTCRPVYEGSVLKDANIVSPSHRFSGKTPVEEIVATMKEYIEYVTEHPGSKGMNNSLQF